VNFRPAQIGSALDVLDAPYLPLIVQEAAGLPLDPSFAEQKRILARCAGLFYGCGNGAEARRFNRMLIDAGLIKGLCLEPPRRGPLPGMRSGAVPTTEFSILPVERIDVAFSPQRWAFADERRSEIDAYWADLVRQNPGLWNGRVLMLGDFTIADGVF